ncbi:MAG: hypothetical protein JNK97_03540 [Zoogloea sp.]|nr:hypothetical protein [Zoogloea sp.]
MTTQNQFEPGETGKARQRFVIYTELLKGAVSTVFARETLGIMSPAARIMELRRQGHKIVTRAGRVVDAAGVSHRSAVYVLVGGAA